MFLKAKPLIKVLCKIVIDKYIIDFLAFYVYIGRSVFDYRSIHLPKFTRITGRTIHLIAERSINLPELPEGPL